MIDKKDISSTLLGHLTQFSERVAEVVDDYNTINGGDLEASEKDQFAAACMRDVATLTGVLTDFVHQTLVEAGIEVAKPPTQSTEADVIDLQQYRANGGLLN